MGNRYNPAKGKILPGVGLAVGKSAALARGVGVGSDWPFGWRRFKTAPSPFTHEVEVLEFIIRKRFCPEPDDDKIKLDSLFIGPVVFLT
jgi:hypothetical protein